MHVLRKQGYNLPLDNHICNGNNNGGGGGGGDGSIAVTQGSLWG